MFKVNDKLKYFKNTNEVNIINTIDCRRAGPFLLQLEQAHVRAVFTLVDRFDIEPYSDFSAKWSNFIRLVLFCIDAKFCKKIFVGKLLTRSTRFTCFCTAQTSNFQKIFVKIFRIFWQKFAKFRYFWILFTDFCSDFDEILSEFRR